MNKQNIIPKANDDAWNIAEGVNNSALTMIRYRPNLEKYVGHPSYSKRLVIRWDYNDNNSSGMPSPETASLQQEFEDRIIKAFDIDDLAILAFIFTSAGSRFWNFYAEDIATIGSRLNQALNGLPKLPIELEVINEPDWDEFRLLLSSCQ